MRNRACDASCRGPAGRRQREQLALDMPPGSEPGAELPAQRLPAVRSERLNAFVDNDSVHAISKMGRASDGHTSVAWYEHD